MRRLSRSKLLCNLNIVSNARLSLGTAQFGEGYGVTNTSGRLSDSAVAEILRAARESHVAHIDTAESYQDALARIGQHLDSPANVSVTSKFWVDDSWLVDPVESIRKQLKLLNRESLQGLLVHNAAAVEQVDASRLRAALDLLVSEGMIHSYGVSVYDERELDVALSGLPGLNIVQFPASIVDTRLLDSTLVAELHARGVQIQTRSAFLQGLLLCNEKNLPGAHRELLPVVSQLNALSAEHGESVLAGTLAFLRHNPIVDLVIVGALSQEQLREIAGAWNVGSPSWAEEGFDVDPRLIDPRLWARS